MKNTLLSKVWQAIPSGIVCLCVIFALFGYIGSIMGVPNMLNTIMKTAHDLLLNTVFYLMGICVITGAIGRSSSSSVSSACSRSCSARSCARCSTCPEWPRSEP